MIDTKELRRLAEAATPGPWVVRDRTAVWNDKSLLGRNARRIVASNEHSPNDSQDYGQSCRDAAFIVATNPAAVIALLDRLDAAEAALAEKDAEMCASLIGQEHRLGGENDILRVEVEKLRRRILAVSKWAREAPCCQREINLNTHSASKSEIAAWSGAPEAGEKETNNGPSAH